MTRSPQMLSNYRLSFEFAVEFAGWSSVRVARRYDLLSQDAYANGHRGRARAGAGAWVPGERGWGRAPRVWERPDPSGCLGLCGLAGLGLCGLAALGHVCVGQTKGGRSAGFQAKRATEHREGVARLA
jgi:hypothetical protein